MGVGMLLSISQMRTLGLEEVKGFEWGHPGRN